MISYLGSAACKLVNMGEGIDWTTEPQPPPAGSDRATMEEFARQYSAWSQSLRYTPQPGHRAVNLIRSASLAPAKVLSLTLKALGFSASKGSNFFLKYNKAFYDQDLARSYVVERNWQDHAKDRNADRKGLPNIRLLIDGANGDPSNFEKRIHKGLRSLELGLLEPEPLGPIHAYLMQRRFRNT